jgi:hypothetical protein
MNISPEATKMQPAPKKDAQDLFAASEMQIKKHSKTSLHTCQNSSNKKY